MPEHQLSQKFIRHTNAISPTMTVFYQSTDFNSRRPGHETNEPTTQQFS